MDVEIRKLQREDIKEAIGVWNQVVEEGTAFPQTECLDENTGAAFFAEQSYTGVAVEKNSGKIIGLYILHPNNVGRCGHICNASYAVDERARGRHVGERLVRHCLREAKMLGFRILQFNAVVRSNLRAMKLYQKLGFVQLGVIPGGFLLKDGTYEDIVPYYYIL